MKSSMSKKDQDRMSRYRKEKAEAETKRKTWEKEQKERYSKYQKYSKTMDKDAEKKWKEQTMRAKKDFEKQMKERKDREKDAREAKRKLAQVARKLNRVKFVKAQQQCFKRLFKVTVGMMCMTCNANYGSYFWNNNGTWQVVMNKKVCSNLMKDCFPYLNATNIQGRNMLDMKRMRKFQRNKAEIQKRLSMLKKKIAASDNDEEIVEALQSYQKKLKASMKLNKTDFTGDAKDDFRYGFRMPLRCVNDTNCEWICQNMIRHDGISDKTIESDQNVKVEDLEQDDDQQFESDLVVVDDSEDEDVEEEA